MPYETDFDTAFTILLGKAQGTISPAPSPTPGGGGTLVPAATSYVICFQFNGGLAASPMLVEVPDPGEIVWAHLYAGGTNGEPATVSATVEVQQSRLETYGGSTPVHGSGSAPSIASSTSGDASLSGWHTHLSAGDSLVGRVTAFSGATTAWLALVLRVRRDNVMQTLLFVVDGSGNTVVDSSGNTVVFRD
jgi:hypothetical protein